jgi:holliday junction DNA helicase RuvA
MIAFVRGTVAAVGLDGVVVDVGGVGLQLQCTPGTLARLRPGAEASLPSSLVVREDSMTLFGFADEDERTLFELLQTASGVGPRLAQAMLAVHPPDELRRAVRDEDVRALTAVSGIGQKGAQRIILELKDRIGPPTGPTGQTRAGSVARPAWRDQVLSALVGLGWSPRDADLAVEHVAPQAGEVPDVPALLRAALQTLSRG